MDGEFNFVLGATLAHESLDEVPQLDVGALVVWGLSRMNHETTVARGARAPVTRL